MKSRLITSFAALITFLIGLGIPTAAVAQDQAPAADPQVYDQPQDQRPADNQAPAQDQSQSSVGRISFMHGDVSHQRGDTGEWSAAALNAPVVAGDAVSTGDNARTEVELDYANILRLNNRTQANIVNMSRSQIQIQLSQGEANYTVLKNGEADVEIDTTNVAVHPAHRDGSYRIDVISNDETRVIVLRGTADISTPQGSTHLQSGEQITIRGTGNDTQYKIADAPGRDDWDQWNNDRDHTILNAHSWKNTDRYYTGSEDLDAYGQWRDVPDYGRVWVPAHEPGWVPYSAGRWVWEPYWGWTWTSYEPWGWAPYHYGRWMYVDDEWAWWPGPVYGGFYRPVWAPAYVSFFGFGDGGFSVGVGFGWGSIGWLPIGPCDHFYPWWGGYRSNINVVNITNITNVTNVTNAGAMPPLRTGTAYSNVYQAARNPNFRRAISTVPADQFGRGRITPRAVTQQQFRNGRMVAGNLPVVPGRQSVSVSGRPAAASTLAHANQPVHFFSTARQAAGTRPSFNQEQAQVQRAIQRTGQPVIGARDVAGTSNLRPGVNNGRANAGGDTRSMNAGPAGTPLNSRGTVNNPAAGNRGAANVRGSGATTAPPGNSNSGWQRFGGPRPPATGNVASGIRGSQANGSQSGAPVMSAQARRPGGDTNSSTRSTRPQNNSGWQSFSRPSAGSSGRSQGTAPAPMNRGTAAPNQPVQQSPDQQTMPAPNRSGNGWQQFTPQRPASSSGATPGRGSGSVWSERPPTPSRGAGPAGGYSSGGYSRQPMSSGGGPGGYSRPPSGGYSRPPLDMRQPIVGPGYSNPRTSAPSSPSYSAPSNPRYSSPSGPRYSVPPSYSPPGGGGYRGGPPSGGGFHGGAPGGGGFQGAPAAGGFHGAPSGGGAPRGGGGGPPRGSNPGGRH